MILDLPCKPVRGQLYKEENRMNLDYDNARACAYAVLKSDPKAVGITWHNPKNGGTKHCWAHKDMSIPIGKIENKDDVNNNFLLVNLRVNTFLKHTFYLK